jgi:tetratricopeptide (TPR) repeat protein
MVGAERERVAEVIVEGVNGPGLRGSGYRVATAAVLTAAHVVIGAKSIRLRFNADREDEWTAPAVVNTLNTVADVAILTFSPRSLDQRVSRVLFGRVCQQPAVVRCYAIGFPRFKLRNYNSYDSKELSGLERYRDSHQADGAISTMSNSREGSLEILVAPPESTFDEQSPWEGMSGAAVWSNGRIIGVITKHYFSDGPNRLTASRVERWYESFSSSDLVRLRELMALPWRADDLYEIIPPDEGNAILSDYISQVEAIAPTNLLDRDKEIADLGDFCVGDELYQWWQAAPWSGKSALAAWFVLHPPVGVRVVSFFVTGRLTGQADSAAFTDALIQQLAVIAGEPPTLAVTPAAREGQRRRLLKQAAARVRERGERLLLVVDGLDEDRGLPPTGASSIAQLLPSDVPEGVRILVTSRPHPGLPYDVPTDHPLRTCTIRSLSPSEHAKYLESEAKRELNTYLYDNDQLKIDIIGFIAAAGGLTRHELVELTGARPTDIEARLMGVFGRSMDARPIRDVSSRNPELAYLFAHESLRETAEQQLGSELITYQDRIHQWALRYLELGWPESTPRYLLRPYSQLLRTIGDLPRLTSLATNSNRHDLMLKHTLDDVGSFLEITETQQLAIVSAKPAVKVFVLLAIEQERLTNRNQAIPSNLPALWVRLGQPERGQALARTIGDPNRKAVALCKLAIALADIGDVAVAQQFIREGEQVARGIPSHQNRSEALTAIVSALGAVDHLEYMERVARSITHPWYGAEALSRLAVAVAHAGDAGRAQQIALDAEQMAQGVAGCWWRTEALTGIAAELAKAGQAEEAARVTRDAVRSARNLSSARERALSLAKLATALGISGQVSQAEHIALESERQASAVEDPYKRAIPLVSVAAALAAVGRLERAERVAQANAIPTQQIKALVEVTEVLVRIGKSNQAKRVAFAAERSTRHISDAASQADALGWVAVSFAVVGLLNRALAIAHDITSPRIRLDTLGWIAAALAKGGQMDQAERVAQETERVARNVGGAWYRAETLDHIVAALIKTGHLRQAERLARGIDAPTVMVRSLGAIAIAWAKAGRANRAEQLWSTIPSKERGYILLDIAEALASVGRIAQAESLARSFVSTDDRSEAFALIAVALARTGHMSEAIEAARSVKSATRNETLSQIAVAIAKLGHLKRAERIARKINASAWRSNSLLTVASVLAKTGHLRRAESVARDIKDRGDRDEALAQVVIAFAKAGRVKHAKRMVEDIYSPTWQAIAQAAIAAGLAKAGRIHKAKLTAESIQSDSWRAEALARVAVTLAKDDRTREVDQILDLIYDRGERAEALVRVAVALASAGHLDHAEQVTRRIAITKERAYAFGRIAIILAKDDQWAKSEQVAQSARKFATGLDDPVDQAYVLARLARDLAKVNNVVLAERIALDIAADKERARTLIYIANRCRKSRQQSLIIQANRICGIALTGSAWYDALPLASQLDIQCPLALVGQILQDQNAKLAVAFDEEIDAKT